MSPSDRDPYPELLRHSRTIFDLSKAADLLVWDQQTMMPAGAGMARGQQLASLSAVLHERITAPELGELLDALEREGAREELDDEQRATVREARRAYDQETRIPAALVEEIAEQVTRAQGVWVEARANDDFGLFAPELERIMDLRRRQADHLGYDAHPYDALHDLYEPGSTVAAVRRVFGPLKEALVRLLERITGSGIDPADEVLYRTYPEDVQERFAVEVITAFGYDFSRGRLDRAAHPFAQAMARDDARITTRYRADYLSSSLFSTMHEAGHAMYEQGIAEAYHRTPLGSPASLGVHESQSRLWENLVGRSHAFWSRWYPRLRELFPEPLADVELETFHRAVNRVAPSLIRVEADEVTYNLHVMIRFELEVAMLEGSLAVRDLPEAWNAAMREALGIVPPDDAAGCLQDVHWAAGLVGYFPTYTLGNLMSVQLYEAASGDVGDLDAQLRAGEYGPLLGWMREHVHRHGARYLPDELLRRATGRGLDAGPYLRYLERKYGALYGLDELELSGVSGQR